MNFELPKLEHAYIIYDPKRKLYSRGGSWVRWSKKPKIWSNIGHLKLHFLSHIDRNYNLNKNFQLDYNYYGHEEIWDITNEKKFIDSVIDFISQMKNEHIQKEHKKDIKRKQAAVREANYQLDKAQQKYTESFNV